MGAWGVECQAASSVELLQLQKATAGFELWGDTKLGWETGKDWMQRSREGLCSVPAVRGSKARGGGCMLGKPTCLLMFGAESPWDAFSVLPLCPAGLGLHSDRLKITFRGKNCSMCTFLMQRLSPRGFGDCSTCHTNSSARATRPEPCAAGCHLLQAQLENCTEGLRAWPSSAATPLCHSIAPGCSSSGVSAHPQPFWAPALHLTPVLTLCSDCRQPPLGQGQKQGHMWECSPEVILVHYSQFTG